MLIKALTNLFRNRVAVCAGLLVLVFDATCLNLDRSSTPILTVWAIVNYPGFMFTPIVVLLVKLASFDRYQLTTPWLTTPLGRAIMFTSVSFLSAAFWTVIVAMIDNLFFRKSAPKLPPRTP